MPRLRRTQSEVFFAYLTTDRHWMAIRDVISLDGTALTERPDLRGAFQRLAAGDVPPKFTEVNSRYNIGRTFRNFNEPTLALLVLDERHRARFSFERKGVEREGNSTLVTIAFTEKDPPTLIQHQRRGRVFSRGEFIVEAGTGRVRRTLLTAKTDALRLELTTTYGPNDRLGMSVPTLFREHYEYGSNARKSFSARLTNVSSARRSTATSAGSRRVHGSSNPSSSKGGLDESNQRPGILDLVDPDRASSGAAAWTSGGQERFENRANPTCFHGGQRPRVDRSRSEGRSRSQGRGSVGRSCQGGVRRRTSSCRRDLPFPFTRIPMP